MDITATEPSVRQGGLLYRTRARVTTVALVLVFIVAGVLFHVHEKPGTENDEHRTLSRYFLTECDTCTCDDIAIIGAGISGTYAAWKLRERGLSVSVYEYSDRIGGRLHTIHFPGIPDINVELGGMRFKPTVHPLMAKTAAVLNLTVVDFIPGLGADGDVLLYLRGVHMRRRDLGNANNPYNLRQSEMHLKHDPDQLRREYFVNYTSYNAGDAVDYAAMLYSRTPDGTPLYAQSVDVAYSTMGASSEAIAYFRDVDGYYFLSGDIISSEVVPEEDNVGHIHTTIPVKTIREGMQAIPEGLVKEFLDGSTRHKMVYNHELFKIEMQSNSTYRLSFWPTKTVGGRTRRNQSKTTVSKCAKKVILSIPRLALDSIDWEGFRDPEVSRVIKHSIKDCPAAKIFIAYDRPWWRELPTKNIHSVTDLPNRQTYDFGSSNFSSKAVLLAGYMDMEGVEFWREVQSRGTSNGLSSDQVNVLSDAALFHATRFVAEQFNVSVSSLPKPLGGVISLWDEFPFGGGWQAWMPGFDWSKIGQKIIKPSASDDVFISTNGFSPNHGSAWAEFALEQTELVVAEIDKSRR